MSFYVIIIGAVVEVIAIVATGIAVGIVMIKSKQATDNTDKVTLRIAATLIGLSILFNFIMFISAFVAFSTRGCTKRKRWILIISASLSALSLLVGLIIIFVTANKYKTAGKSADAQNLRGAGGTVLVALVLHVIAFILLWLVIGRRLAQIGKQCRRIAPKIQAAKAQVATVTQTVATA